MSVALITTAWPSINAAIPLHWFHKYAYLVVIIKLYQFLVVFGTKLCLAFWSWYIRLSITLFFLSFFSRKLSAQTHIYSLENNMRCRINTIVKALLLNGLQFWILMTSAQANVHSQMLLCAVKLFFPENLYKLIILKCGGLSNYDQTLLRQSWRAHSRANTING